MSDSNPYEAPQSKFAHELPTAEEAASSFPPVLEKLFKAQCVCAVALGLFRGSIFVSGNHALLGLFQFYLGVCLAVMTLLLFLAARHYEIAWLYFVEIFVFAIPLLIYGLWAMQAD
jgi:hypothetical protein